MPYLPSIEFDMRYELEHYADKKKADVYWWQQPWTVSYERDTNATRRS
jgi:hypothetical protein